MRLGFSLIDPELRERFREAHGEDYPCACGRPTTRIWAEIDPETQEITPTIATCEIRSHFPEGGAALDDQLRLNVGLGNS